MMLGFGGECCVWVSAFFSFLFYSFAFLMITHDTLASNFIFTFRLCNDRGFHSLDRSMFPRHGLSCVLFSRRFGVSA